MFVQSNLCALQLHRDEQILPDLSINDTEVLQNGSTNKAN